MSEQHVVSVMPRQMFDGEPWEFPLVYRAHCTCGRRSTRLDTMAQGEQWGRAHCASGDGLQASKLTNPEPKGQESHSETPNADEEA